MSFELELLRTDGSGRMVVVDRVGMPIELTLAKVMAQDILRKRHRDGREIDVVRGLDPEGNEVFLVAAG